MHKIIASDKQDFNNLIRAFRQDGYMIVTYRERFCELEKGDDFIVIEY